MADKIYVLHVVKRMDRGGTEALLMNLLRTIDREKFQFDFVVQTQDHCDYDEEIASLQSKIYHAPALTKKNYFSYKKWWKGFFKQHPEYRIIHGHSRGSAPIYLSEAKKAGVVTIAHCHNNSFGKGAYATIRTVWQKQLRNLADYNFACSRDSGIEQFGEERFEVIINGIQAEKYVWNSQVREDVRDEMCIGDKFVVGHVGRFCEQKNHRFLIDVFDEIRRIEPNSILLLAGRGPLENEIKNYVDTLNLSDQVRFLGVREDVPRILQAMDVFALPSIFEGLGIVNIEAQAAGLPCFSSAEVVAPESKVTDLMTFIPLDNNPKEWAEIILSKRQPIEQRRNTLEEIRKSGFDIIDTANYLCEFYQRIDDGIRINKGQR